MEPRTGIGLPHREAYNVGVALGSADRENLPLSGSRRMDMMKAKLLLASLTIAPLLVGCVQQPAGPTVAVMPAPYKPFEVFQQDQAICMAYGQQMTNGQAQAANTQSVGAAVVGTALGAGLGAAIGGGTGAAIGAASGALGGTVVASGPAYSAQGSLQQRYDIAYSQCMYAKGNQVPGFAAPTSPPPPPPPPNYAAPASPPPPPPPSPG
jgi:outer membrane lipoprotein SlyB